MNVHPGESLDDVYGSLQRFAQPVHKAVCPDEPFGLGLRLSNEASVALSHKDELARLRAVLSDNGLYAFTVNAFPYGRFHGSGVKERVYAPDWRTRERKDYTTRVARALAHLLDVAEDGSISTVPGSYRPWISTDADRDAMSVALADVVHELADIEAESGKCVHVGLEPEPDCYLESPADVVRFFEDSLLPVGMRHLVNAHGRAETEAESIIRRHVGVCLDACHCAAQFEDLAAGIRKLSGAGIRLSKIHLSASPVFSGPAEAAMGEFADDVYLHQVRMRSGDGTVARYRDLPEALAAREDEAEAEWRVHCHVPLYYEGSGPWRSTADELTPHFFALAVDAGARHFEIETYTFDVLPPTAREGSLVESIIREYRWAVERMRSTIRLR